MKFFAACHLGALFVMALFGLYRLYQILIERNGLDAKTIILIDVPVFLLANTALLAYYFVSEHRERGKGTGKTLLSLVILPLYGIGLAPGITLGVLEGLVRTGGIFVRTPKFGDKRDDETDLPVTGASQPFPFSSSSPRPRR